MRQELLYVWTLVIGLSGCATVAGKSEENSLGEDRQPFSVSCPHRRTQEVSCDELDKAYKEGFEAGKEIVAAEFRTRTELNQPYVWKPPLISDVDMPARVVNGVMIPAHRELVIVRPGQWVRTQSLIEGK